jgi:hypothetical protein
MVALLTLNNIHFTLNQTVHFRSYNFAGFDYLSTQLLLYSATHLRLQIVVSNNFTFSNNWSRLISWTCPPWNKSRITLCESIITGSQLHPVKLNGIYLGYWITVLWGLPILPKNRVIGTGRCYEAYEVVRPEYRTKAFQLWIAALFIW